METATSPTDLLTYTEEAELLGTAPTFVQERVAQRLGHRVRLRSCDLEAHIGHARIPARGQ